MSVLGRAGSVWVVPFPDELRPVEVVAYRESWPSAFAEVSDLLEDVVGSDEAAIDHIGSTAVPGLAAKDVIDVQVRVRSLDRQARIPQFGSVGFRWRSEQWNNLEASRHGPEPKLVFASAPGERRVNINIRVDGSCGSADALLFRDYLRDDPPARVAWGEFKQYIVRSVPAVDLIAYGQIKQPAWITLMAAADAWAQDRQWQPAVRSQPGPPRSSVDTPRS